MSDFYEAIDKSCKEECSLTSKRNPIFKPWITPGIINSSNKKHKLHKQWEKSKKNKKDQHDKGDPVLYSNLCTYRKKLKYLIRSAKDKHYKNKMAEVNGDPKATWKLINNLRGKTKSKILPSFIIDGELVTNKRKIATAFNNYFVSIAQKLNDGDTVPVDPLPSFISYMSNRI